MNIVLFGGTGYIGSALSRNLCSNVNIKVTVTGTGGSRNNFSKQGVFFKAYSYDKSDLEWLITLKPKYIFYLISLDHNKSQENYERATRINVGLFSRILDFIRLNKLSTRLIYISTVQIFKNSDIKKQHIAPQNVYGFTHFWCENLLSQTKDIDWAIVRLANSYGVPVNKNANIWWNVIPSFIDQAIKNKEINVNSDGTPLRSFIHIDDVSRALILILENWDHYKFKKMLLSGQYVQSIANLVSEVKQILHEQIGDVRINLPPHFNTGLENFKVKNDPKNYIMLPKKYHFKTLNQGISELVEYISCQ